MLRLACLLLLVLASAALHAREVRLSDAGGSGGACPDLAAAVAEADARAPRTKPPAQGVAPARAKPAAKPAASRGSDDDGRMQAPRWHSFLPGMFR